MKTTDTYLVLDHVYMPEGGQAEGHIHESADGPVAVLEPFGDVFTPRLYSRKADWLRGLAKTAAELADALEARQEDYRAAQAAAAELASLPARDIIACNQGHPDCEVYEHFDPAGPLDSERWQCQGPCHGTFIGSRQPGDTCRECTGVLAARADGAL